jgi:hypothetical protein
MIEGQSASKLKVDGAPTATGQQDIRIMWRQGRLTADERRIAEAQRAAQAQDSAR